MITKVDWLSFFVPMPASGRKDEREVFYEMQEALNAIDAGMIEALGVFTIPLPGKGRAPYRQSWAFKQEGVTLFTHPNLNHALVEISGHGCLRLEAMDVMEPILELVRNRATRLDIACDMLCDTTPAQFVAERLEGRHRSSSNITSDSGQTCYVGSPKSDRYARVYRYAPPHDRAHLLRCEYVVKGENAKLAIDAILGSGIEGVAAAHGNAFGWQHKAWTEDAADPAEVAVWRPERHNGRTEFWLNDTIAPLLARMHNERSIDIYQWLTDHVIPRIITDEPQ